MLAADHLQVKSLCCSRDCKSSIRHELFWTRVLTAGKSISQIVRFTLGDNALVTMVQEQVTNERGRSLEKTLGHVLSCRGSQARVGLPAPVPLGDQRATVGKFVAIRCGFSLLVGMIAEVSATDPEQGSSSGYRAIAHVDLMGEIVRDETGVSKFQRGVREYPAIGDTIELLRRYDLKTVYSGLGADAITVGQLHQDPAIPAYVDVDNLIAKHFAILGSTGVGKSSGVAVILNEILRARSDVRILLLDIHNEYTRSFGAAASVIGSDELKLPFWLMNFEEFTDVIYGGRPAIPEEVEILAELIPAAKSTYAGYKAGGERSALARRQLRGPTFSTDTPAPYLIQDLLSLIDERMGRLENRSSRMIHNRLMSRIEQITNDPRYAFMFENANVGGDTMATALNQLFRLESEQAGITVLKLASVPGEVVDAVVCVAARLAFEFGLWSDGGMPLLLVCEEAHRYASADHTVGFAPARRALSRIAKEGRKYGVHLGLVTQRPAELDRTIIWQCSTMFVMRMASDDDHSLVRSATSDAASNLLSFVPSLGTGEVIGFGEGMPLAARFTFRTLPAETLPCSEPGVDMGSAKVADRSSMVRQAIERWRNATMGNVRPAEPEAPVPPRPRMGLPLEGSSALTRGIQSLAAERAPVRSSLMTPEPALASKD
jgi:DNA helicase HerA-like ATPase